MKTKKSLIIYFSVVVLLVVLCYGLKTTFAYFVASEQGTATNIKVAKLTYKLESESLENNAITLKPNEIKKINVSLTSEYDMATIYRLNYIGNVTVLKSSTSENEVKNLIDAKSSKNINLVILNNTLEEQTVIFEADGGYVGNELTDGNITEVYDETLLQNKLLIDGTLTLTDIFDYRDVTGTNNYIKVEDTIYRVLGVFKENKTKYLKIITDETIGKNIFGENNNYLTSSLNTFLNVDYYETLDKLLKDNIKEVTYYTAGLDKMLEINPLENILEEQEKPLTYYDYERGELIANEKFNANGVSKIGLMYISDYNYAENWIKKPYTELTITPNTSDEKSLFCVNYREEIEKKINDEGKEEEINKPINELASNCDVSKEFDIRPVMYLENKLVIESGIGTLEEPYIVKLDTEE